MKKLRAHLDTATGVRPSSAAATCESSNAWENSSAESRRSIAAPEDGRTPFTDYPDISVAVSRCAQKLPLLLLTVFLPLAAYAGEWTVLFDGKPTDKLRGYKQKGFPTNNWVIDGDALKTIPGKAVDLVTADQYESFELEFEWKVQPGGNSGVMYRVAEGAGASWATGPELQILDDAKHPDGRNPKTSAGSLYALIAPKESRKLNPVGEFNKTKLVMKNNHVEHWLNGEKVVEYEWGSPEIKELVKKSKFKDMPEFMTKSTGHVAFQHHGEEAWFRNIRIRKL